MMLSLCHTSCMHDRLLSSHTLAIKLGIGAASQVGDACLHAIHGAGADLGGTVGVPRPAYRLP
jgi:hypothetical protein